MMLGLGLGLMACGSGPGAGSASMPSPSPSLQPSPSPQAATTAYHDPTWDYSIQFPSTWHDVTMAVGGTAPQEHVVSDAAVSNTNTLDGLDGQGVMFRIIVQQVNSGCPNPRSTDAVLPAGAEIVPVSGASAVMFQNNDMVYPSGKHVWDVQAEAASQLYCYAFVGLALSASSRDSMLTDFRSALQTFQFGSPHPPPYMGVSAPTTG